MNELSELETRIAVKSIGEEYQELLDKGLVPDEAKAVLKVRHSLESRSLKCPSCGSENTFRKGKRCSHEYNCRNCGYWWCAYYQLMSPEERENRKRWTMESKGMKRAA